MDDKTPDDDGLRPYADLYPEDGDVFRDPNWEEDPPGSGVWRVRRELRERLDGERMRRLMNRWLGEPSDDGDPLPFVDLYPEDGDVFDDPNWEEDPPGSGIWRLRRGLRERLDAEAIERLMRPPSGFPDGGVGESRRGATEDESPDVGEWDPERLYPEDGNVFDDPNWEEDPPGSGIWQVRRELRERLALEAAERLMRRRLDD